MNSRYKKREEYSSFLDHIKEERESSSTFAKSLLSFVMGMVCVLAFSVWFVQQEDLVKGFFGEDSLITQELLSIGNSIRTRGRTTFNFPLLGGPRNILLLGVDSNGQGSSEWEGTRSDTIILMNIDPRDHSVNAISIPRDSKVYLPNNQGVNKINAAHALGGIQLTKQTVENTLGIKVDKYIIVHDEAVREVIDALGGVPIYVEKKMYYNDNAGHLHIDLHKGINVLNGTQAVGYLRFGHDGLGDIGRTQRQQRFLKGLLEKVKSPQTFAKLPQILNIAQKYIKTDMSVYELSQLVSAARGFQDGNVQIATLPGGPNLHGYTSYWILDPEQVQDVVNRLIYREETPVDPNQHIVGGIMYSSSKATEAHQIKSQLESMGYKINCVESERLPHSQFIAHNDMVTNSFYKYVRKHVAGIDKMQYVYDPLRNYCVNSDFTIILAN